jgi:hypothetical protein
MMLIRIILFIGKIDNDIFFPENKQKKYISKMRKIILKILLPIIKSHSENSTHTNYNKFIHSINIKNNNDKFFSYYRNIFILLY